MLERRLSRRAAATRTSAFVRDCFPLVLVHIEEKRREICAASLLPDLEQLPGRLEENVDGGVVLSRLLIARGERSSLLVRLVGLPGLYQREDGV